jgi:hypothetical protein
VLQAQILEGDGPGRRIFATLDRPLPVVGGHVMIATGTQKQVVVEALAAGALDRDDRESVDVAAAARLLSDLPVSEALARLRAGGVAAVAVCREPGDLATEHSVAHLLDIESCAFVRSPWKFARHWP